MRLTSLFKRLRGEQGSSVMEMALVTPTLVLFLVAAFDFGRAYYLANEVEGAAHAGAEYGTQNPKDATGIAAAVTNDAPDVANLSAPTVSYGCECSDGSSSSTNCSSTPSCTDNVVYWVKVTASANYKPVFPWPGIPSTVPLSSTAVMRTSNL